MAFDVENNPGSAWRRLGSKEAPAAAVRLESNFRRLQPWGLIMVTNSLILRARNCAGLVFLFSFLPVVGGSAVFAQEMSVRNTSEIGHKMGSLPNPDR